MLLRLTSRTSCWMSLRRNVTTILKWKTRKPTIEVENVLKAKTLLVVMAQHKAFHTEVN